MQNLKRNLNVGFRVTPEEKEMIERRMAQTSISSLRQYLLKMAVDGRVIELNLDSVTECSRLLANVSNNINQIAKRVNIDGSAYAADMEQIKAQLGEVWDKQNEILKKVAKLLEVV